MKTKLITIILLAIVFLSCNNNPQENETTAQAENDLDAARNFIQAALKGDFPNAAKYMLPDSVNEQRLDAVSRLQRTPDEKQGLWSASINIHNRNVLNDSTSIIIYSNSYYKDNTDTLKVVKINGKWLVDFKYLFDHDQQPIQPSSIKNNSLTK